MPAPYSDNLYSALDEDEYNDVSRDDTSVPAPPGAQDDQDDALSPADGYFRASDAQHDSPFPERQSGNVPHVPNVLVEDPSLRQREQEEEQDADAKRREAEREQSLNTLAQAHAQPSQPSTPSTPFSPAQPRYHHQSSSSSVPRGHHHRRSVEEDDSIHFESEQPERQQPQETSPLFQQQPVDAPPAYTPSSQSPRSPSATYQTFGAPPANAGMGLPDERQRLLPGREPQSMGGDSTAGDSPVWWQRIIDSGRSLVTRRRLKTILGLLVILSLICMFLGGFVYDPDNKKHSHDSDGDAPQQPENPGEAPSPPTYDGDMDWKHRKYCREPDHPFSLQTQFGARYSADRNISIIERVVDKERGHNYRRPQIEGDIVLRPEDDNHANGDVRIDIMTNDRNIVLGVQFDETTQTLDITSRREMPWQWSGAPCVQMRVTMWIPKNAALQEFAVDSLHLNVNILKGLELGVEKRTQLTTIVGDVKAPEREDGSKGDPYSISKRETIVRTVSGDISGWYAMYDLFSAKSISGSVKVDVEPKPADPSAPKPAKLVASSKSGAIEVREPIDAALESTRPEREFPAREYEVDLETTSGDITAAVAATTRANVLSQSGDLRLRIWPVLDAQRPERLDIDTSTKSGDVEATILEPLFTGIFGSDDHRMERPSTPEVPAEEGKEPWVIIHPHISPELDARVRSSSIGSKPRPWTNVQSEHKTVSGDQKIRYPSNWEGALHAQTISGNQIVRGEGLTISRETGTVMKTVEGWKGDGHSRMRVSSVSGNEDVLIGKA